MRLASVVAGGERWAAVVEGDRAFDGSTRLGPWVTTVDEVEDPGNLALTTRVNGELRQSNTSRAI